MEASDLGSGDRSGDMLGFVGGLRRKVSLTLGGGLPWSDSSDVAGESEVAV